jgi:hypothetical protein
MKIHEIPRQTQDAMGLVERVTGLVARVGMYDLETVWLAIDEIRNIAERSDEDDARALNTIAKAMENLAGYLQAKRA